MYKKEVKTEKDIHKIVVKAINNLRLKKLSHTHGVYKITNPIDIFHWGNEVVLSIETINIHEFVIEVNSSSILGNIFNGDSNLESKIITEILNLINK